MSSYKNIRTIIAVIITVVIASVSFHSVQEIHYLKTFFPPRSFTVTEAFYGALIEVVKVVLIAFPFLIGWKFFGDIPREERDRSSE